MSDPGTAMELTETSPETGDRDEIWLTPFDWAGDADIDEWLAIGDDNQPEHLFPYPSGLP